MDTENRKPLQGITPQEVTDDKTLEQSKLMEDIIAHRVKSDIESETGEGLPVNAIHTPSPAPNPLPPIDLQASQPIDTNDVTDDTTNPIGTDSALSETITNDDMAAVPSPKELKSSTTSKLDKLLDTLLTRLQTAIDSAELHPVQLLPLLKAVADLKLTDEWTSKLSSLIARNPSNLLPPGISSGPLATKLRNYASTGKGLSKDDKRTTRDKLRRSLGGNQYPTD